MSSTNGDYIKNRIRELANGRNGATLDNTPEPRPGAGRVPAQSNAASNLPGRIPAGAKLAKGVVEG